MNDWFKKKNDNLDDVLLYESSVFNSGLGEFDVAVFDEEVETLTIKVDDERIEINESDHKESPVKIKSEYSDVLIDVVPTISIPVEE